jgi:hypothetical protein
MMPSTKKPRRHSRIKSSNSLSRQLAGLGRTIRESFQGNWRQHRLRSQRKRRLRSNPPAEQQLLALRRFLQFRWLQRRLQRSPRDPQQPRNLTPWLWSRASGSLSTRDAAALLLRHSAAALVLLILISLALNAIPLQLTSPNWYVQVLAYIAENVPALLLASGFATLSLLLAGNSDVSNTYRSRLLRLSRLGYILALLLLPLQLAFTAWLFGQTYTAQRTQLSAIRANAEALIAGAQQTTTTEQFVAYLRVHPQRQEYSAGAGAKPGRCHPLHHVALHHQLDQVVFHPVGVGRIYAQFPGLATPLPTVNQSPC